MDELEVIKACAQRREAKHLVFFTEEVRQKLGQEKFNLVVLGEFKRGKTTFLNALLGVALLPTAVVPLTSIVTIIQYGALEFIKKIIEEQTGYENINIIPLSAKTALEGKLKNDEKMLSASNFPEFTRLLEQFLLTEKGTAMLKAACKKGIGAAGELLMGMELEIKALTIPLEELHSKISLFDRMVEELNQEQQDNKYIFKGELEKVYH